MTHACPFRVCFASYLTQEPGRWPHATESESPRNPVPVQLRFEVPARIALPGEGCRRHRCDLRPLYLRGTAEEAQTQLSACILWDPVWRPAIRRYEACARRASGNLLTITSVCGVVNKRR